VPALAPNWEEHMKRKTKFRPGQMVEAIQSCSVDVEGVPYTFSSKSKPIRGDHPAVQSNPDLFRAIEEDEAPEARQSA
jgi:hypothetical protein